MQIFKSIISKDNDHIGEILKSALCTLKGDKGQEEVGKQSQAINNLSFFHSKFFSVNPFSKT